MIGSVYKLFAAKATFATLVARLINSSIRWDDGKPSGEIAIYPYFRKYCPYEFKIMLIKQYEVADRHQLRAYETLWCYEWRFEEQ
ncbi:Hypothetical protein PHPALM_7239 [Phytophthora palmivora]|uniref:Uncharacterized protein n=1 Tax=Phytophthora palmivora TaxID=4796 RepID=A0A2P4YCW2_9STRA|nr:Hypothetical protein PHPALM_7239 [Phytophthora palmivora]